MSIFSVALCVLCVVLFCAYVVANLVLHKFIENNKKLKEKINELQEINEELQAKLNVVSKERRYKQHDFQPFTLGDVVSSKQNTPKEFTM